MNIRKRVSLFLGLLFLAAVSVTACGKVGGGQGSAGAPAGEKQEEFQKLEITDSKSDSEPEAAGEADGGGKTDAAGEAEAVTGAEQADGEALPGIPIDKEKAEAVSIYYGSVCYSFFSEEREAIDQVAGLFTGFSLEEAPDGELDPDTTYQVYFSTDSEQVAAVNADKNGVFYLPEEKKFYRVKAGTFHFETLDKIYRDSMYADGFDENQCLIQ